MQSFSCIPQDAVVEKVALLVSLIPIQFPLTGEVRLPSLFVSPPAESSRIDVKITGDDWVDSRFNPPFTVILRPAPNLTTDPPINVTRLPAVFVTPTVTSSAGVVVIPSIVRLTG